MHGFFYGEGKYQYKDGGFYQGEYKNTKSVGKNKLDGNYCLILFIY